MRLFLAIFRQEWQTQSRALRFRVSATLYVALGSLPPILTLLRRHHYDTTWGSVTYAAQIQTLQPFLTVLLAMLVAGHESGLEAQVRRWPVLSSAAISNGTFLILRWLSIALIILATSLLPLTVAALCAVVGEAPFHEIGPWIWPWLLHVVPIALAVSATWLGLITIATTELGALALGFFGWTLLLTSLNEVLLHYRFMIDRISDWFAFQEFNRWFYYWSREYLVPQVATEAPFDVRSFAVWALPLGTLTLGTGAAVLGLAVAFLRRTRRDLKPMVMRKNHPLRTFLPAWHRFRQRYSPDAALSRGDRAILLLGALALVAAIGFRIERQHHFHQLGAERYRTEMTEDRQPLPETIRPTRFAVDGTFDGLGLDLQVEWTLEHDGEAPRAEIPLTLEENMHVLALEADGRPLTYERSWDRLFVHLERPLQPGETRTFRAHIAGRPALVQLPLLRRSQDSFVTQWEGLIHARFSRDLSDLSRTRITGSASPRRIAFGASTLMPLPRYSPWTLTPPPEGPGEPGRQVPEEVVPQFVDVSLRLRSPQRWFLASHCGDASQIDGTSSLLETSCRSRMAAVLICGGQQRPVPGDGTVHLYALPPHVQAMAEHRDSFETLAQWSGRAWPGLEAIDRLTALEWPPAFEHNPRLSGQISQKLQIYHRLILIPEARIAAREPIELSELVGNLLADRLILRRPIDRRHRLPLERMLRFLILRRMGFENTSRATVSVRSSSIDVLTRPLLRTSDYNRLTWGTRLPAIMVELLGRAGQENVLTGLDNFLNAPTEEPGTVLEALREIEALSGIDLDTWYSDYFEGSALPQLQLEDVEVRKADSEYVVTGQVRNIGTGHTLCPVVAKGETAEQQVQVGIQPEADAPFTLRLPFRPHTVQIDPTGTCHRYQTAGSQLLERVTLEDTK